MRITGGKLKGRVTETPYGKMAIRPAMDRMRESLFDILDSQLKGKSFLDLFSGSGTIALEAVSHGATNVSLCEMDRSKAKIIFKNVSMAEELGVRINCHFMAVELYLKRCKEKFDFVFFDPPFPYKFRLELLQILESRKILNPEGTVLIHYPAEDPLPEKIGSLELVDKRIYGRSIVNFYKYAQNNSENKTCENNQTQSASSKN